MSLYRLDYIDPARSGHYNPVLDAIMGGDFLCRDRKRAMARAREEAAAKTLPVAVSRISGAGFLKRVSIVGPDGSARRPS